jgi:S-adenosylmethionine hydrolase
MRPVVLFTDYGTIGPYVGQLKTALLKHGHAGPVVDLMADAPVFDPQASAHLLAALCPQMPDDCVMLCVVDPGVGTDRHAVVMEADGRFFVGPGNGLLEIVARRATMTRFWRIVWEPTDMSATFHGRDLFAPVAARLAQGMAPRQAGCVESRWDRQEHWPDDLYRVIYVDGFGNVMTGIRARTIGPDSVVTVHGHALTQARTFGDRPVGQSFWYKNSIGLVELTVNAGRANICLGIDGPTAVGVQKNTDASSGAKA